MVPLSLKKLLERYSSNRNDYEAPSYGETETRRELIDPLFKALGWDIDNDEGNAEDYKDVVHEDAVKVGDAHKSPDYSFRIGGVRKFFLEAKKPSVALANNASAAFQLRRYAWSAKLQLSVLTNFRELAIYDGRVKPAATDNAATARVFYKTYDQYEDCWEQRSRQSCRPPP